MKNFLSTSMCLASVTFQKIQRFLDESNKKVIGKMTDVSERKIIGDFVWIKFKDVFHKKY